MLCCMLQFAVVFFFFFNDTATTEIYTLSLHDALPIWVGVGVRHDPVHEVAGALYGRGVLGPRHHQGRQLVQLGDRKSTRLNSSHSQISYAVFCLKKKKSNTCIDVAPVLTSVLIPATST